MDRVVDAIPVHDLLTRSPLSLVDPARAAAAAHLEQLRMPIWIVMVALQIGVLAWFWNAGLSARLRDALRARTRSEFAARFCFGALLALLDKAVALVPMVFQYRFSRIMGVTDLLLRTWLLEWIVGTMVAMIAAGLIAAIVLWLVDRTHQWYVYTIAGIMGITLLVTYAAPILPGAASLTTFTLSHNLASDEASLQAQTNVRVPIVQEHISESTRTGNAYVAGWGGSQRIAISDTLLAGSTQPEIRFVLARAYAWILANNGLHLALVQGGMLVLGIALAVFISDRIGFRRDDDPVSRLALLGAILGLVYLVALPFYNAYARSLDFNSDREGLAFTHDPAAAIRLEVRSAEQSLTPVCPHWFAYAYLENHPSPGIRIARIRGSADPCSRR